MTQLDRGELTVAQLGPDTRLGSVHLTVSDVERSVAFYRDAIGLSVQTWDGDTAYLGAGGPNLLALTENRQAVPVRGHTGLYHFALLTPTRLALAEALQRLIATQTRITGGSDHGVSEALYLDDPDGNGIEIYRDRPRSDWPAVNGRLQMTIDPLDYGDILSELDGAGAVSEHMERETVMGHVHLHVADLEAALAFYTHVVGFDLMQRYGNSAAFVSAGGYHHHIGLNTWQGVGAPPPPSNAIGLRHYVVELASEAERDALLRRLEDAEAQVEYLGADLRVYDPSRNAIVFAVAGATPSTYEG